MTCIMTDFFKCDTFSRSADAVFELSMRFAEPFKIADSLAADERIEAERLMFLELTQGKPFAHLTGRNTLITCV
jgi:hypothetical protein